MRNIIAFSGGKDSTALAIWAKNNLDDFEIIFCDTGWEHAVTYQFLQDFSKSLAHPIKVIRSEKYFSDPLIFDALDDRINFDQELTKEGFWSLTLHKKRVASSRARFCTEKLKVEPMIDYILDHTDGDVIIYQGLRRQESYNRSFLSQEDDFFANYFEPYSFRKDGTPRYHTYRKSDVVARTDKAEIRASRPLLKWDHGQVFDYIKHNQYQYNPLYDLGVHRVGCYPCVMVNQQEFWALIEADPSVVDRIRSLEEATKSSFFRPDYIPQRYHNRETINKSGDLVTYSSVDAVVRYLKDKHATGDMFAMAGLVCKNIYVPCE